MKINPKSVAYPKPPEKRQSNDHAHHTIHHNSPAKNHTGAALFPKVPQKSQQNAHFRAHHHPQLFMQNQKN
jgi:hypothetical protein